MDDDLQDEAFQILFPFLGGENSLNAFKKYKFSNQGTEAEKEKDKNIRQSQDSHPVSSPRGQVCL